jgi:hypothetical protein
MTVGTRRLVVAQVFIAAALLLWPVGMAADVADPADAIVVQGHARLVGRAHTAVASGFRIARGSELKTAENELQVSLPDKTRLTIGHNAGIRFVGFSDAKQHVFSLDVLAGEIILDTKNRPSETGGIHYRVTTPLHTVITFRATRGNIIISDKIDRIECDLCAPGDFEVRSLDKVVALDEPGKVATVTADKGIVVAMDVLRLAVAYNNSGAHPQFNWNNGAAMSSGSWGTQRVNEVAVEVRAAGGDRSSIVVCPDQYVRLTASGGQGAYRAASTNGSVVGVFGIGPNSGRYTSNSPEPGLKSFSYALKPTVPGNSEVTVMDADGKSALVALHVLDPSSSTCRVYRRIQANKP